MPPFPFICFSGFIVQASKLWFLFFALRIISAERCIAKKYGAETSVKVKESAFTLAYVLIEGELLKIIPCTKKSNLFNNKNIYVDVFRI